MRGSALDHSQFIGGQHGAGPFEPFTAIADDLRDLEQVLALAAAPLGDPCRQGIVCQLIVIADQAQQTLVLQRSQRRPQPWARTGQTGGDLGCSAGLLGPADADKFIEQPGDSALGNSAVAGFELGLEFGLLLIEEPGHDIAQLAGLGDLRIGEGNRPAAARRDPVQVIKIDLQISELHAHALVIELVNNQPSGIGTVFERNSVRRGRAKDDLFDIAVGHHLDPQPLVKQRRHGAFKRIERGEVFFAQQDYHPARDVRLKHRLDRGVKRFLLGLAAQHVQLFELVEDQEHRAQMIEEDRADRRDRLRSRRDWGDRRSGQRLIERGTDTIAAPYSQRQPVGRAVFRRQPALHQTGLAGARLAVHQHQAAFTQQPVQRLDLVITAEEHGAVLRAIGVKELERRGCASRERKVSHRRATVERNS